MLDFEIYTGPAHLPPRDAMRRMLHRMPTRAHVIADSAIGGFEMANELSSLEAMATFSISINDHKYLWHLLQRDLQPGAWRAVGAENSRILVSTFHNLNDDGSTAIHHLLTTAYTYTLPDAQGSAVPAVQDRVFSRQDLLSMTKQQLSNLAVSHGIIASGTKSKMVARIHQILSERDQQSTEVDRILATFDQTSFRSHPEHHQFYRDNFNGGDLHNRLWYKFDFSFKVKYWRAKFLISILEDITNERVGSENLEKGNRPFVVPTSSCKEIDANPMNNACIAFNTHTSLMSHNLVVDGV